MSAIQLNEIPKDIKQYILKIQGEIKTRKAIGVYSLQQTILQIIREHRESKDKQIKPSV
jgi:hypothetical protein